MKKLTNYVYMARLAGWLILYIELNTIWVNSFFRGNNIQCEEMKLSLNWLASFAPVIHQLKRTETASTHCCKRFPRFRLIPWLTDKILDLFHFKEAYIYFNFFNELWMLKRYIWHHSQIFRLMLNSPKVLSNQKGPYDINLMNNIIKWIHVTSFWIGTEYDIIISCFPGLHRPEMFFLNKGWKMITIDL